MHSFIESDDRIHVVLKYLDEAMSELNGMDSVVSSYKIHLNVGIFLGFTFDPSILSVDS